MNPRLFPALACCGLFLWINFANAEENQLRVSIVGNQQVTCTANAGGNGKPLTVPVISLPGTSTVDSPPPKGASFFVILQNIGEKPVRLIMSSSGWYDCLKFEITSPSGKTFQIDRIPIPWAANGLETWVLEPQDIRILTVNFHDQTWEGFPSQSNLPLRQLFKITALFRPPSDPQQKEPGFLESKVTDAFSY